MKNSSHFNQLVYFEIEMFNLFSLFLSDKHQKDNFKANKKNKKYLLSTLKKLNIEN